MQMKMTRTKNIQIINVILNDVVKKKKERGKGKEKEFIFGVQLLKYQNFKRIIYIK